MVVVAVIAVMAVVCAVVILGKGDFSTVIESPVGSVLEASISSPVGSVALVSSAESKEELPSMFRYIPMMTEDLPKPDIFV